tara:strand:- start:678 stop:1187 length:510 start_codon:yes stop_codon:yes gene_type:complete
MKIAYNVLSRELLDDCLDSLNEMIPQQCWSSSNMIWKPHLKQGLNGSCLTSLVPHDLNLEIQREIRRYVPKHTKIMSQYYIWQPNSGIAIHDDEHHIFGATIYLNQDWHPNAGGWFIWADQGTERSGIYKAILPEFNSMVVNDNSEPHLVTSVSPDTPDFRYTIQIWGD